MEVISHQRGEIKMLFLVKIKPRLGKAKTKGAIDFGNAKWKRFETDSDPVTFAVRALDVDELYAKLCNTFLPNDQRGLAGKSYLNHNRCLMIGDLIHASPFTPKSSGSTKPGKVVGFINNTIKIEDHETKEVATFDIVDLVDYFVQ